MDEIIVEEILWTESAKLSLNAIVEYLKKNWTERETTQFVNRTQDVLLTLKRYPEMFRLPLKKRMSVLLC